MVLATAMDVTAIARLLMPVRALMLMMMMMMMMSPAIATFIKAALVLQKIGFLGHLPYSLKIALASELSHRVSAGRTLVPTKASANPPMPLTMPQALSNPNPTSVLLSRSYRNHKEPLICLQGTRKPALRRHR